MLTSVNKLGGKGIPPGQGFPSFHVHESPAAFTKMQSLIQQVCSWARESVFLTSSHVTAMLLVPLPHFGEALQWDGQSGVGGILYIYIVCVCVCMYVSL